MLSLIYGSQFMLVDLILVLVILAGVWGYLEP